MNNIDLKGFLRATSCLCVLGLSTVANAQSGAQNEGDIEELLIQARTLTDTSVGKDQSFNALGQRDILDTPFSVTSFTDALIDSTNARSLRDILVRDPSVSSEDQAGGFLDEFTIRGFNVGRGAFIYDGMPNVLPVQGFINAAGLSRIEVFRGANAIIAGASATNRSGPGGAFNLIPKRPVADPVNDVSLTFLPDSAIIGTADFSRRFGANDQFGARFVASVQEGNLNLDDLSRSNHLFSMYLNWRPFENLDINSQVARIKDQTDGYRDNFDVAGGFELPSGVPDPRRNYGQSWTEVEQATGWLTTVQAKYSFNEDWSLSAGYGRYKTDDDNRYVAYFCTLVNQAGDLDCFTDIGNVLTENQTVNVIANGSFETGSLTHLSTVGFSVSDVFQQFIGFGFAEVGMSNIFNPVVLPAVTIPDEPDFVGGGNTKVRNILVKHEIITQDERFSVIGGFNAVKIVDRYFADYEGSKVSPFGTLSFKPSENSTLYVSYTQGLETGGTAMPAVNVLESLPPLTSQQYEAGFKLRLGDMLLTGAIFNIERELEFEIPFDNGMENSPPTILVQDGNQVHRGAELQITGQVIDNLEVIAGITYLDAEIRELNDPAVNGNRAPGVPEWSGSIFLNYNANELWEGLSFNAGMRFESAQFVDQANVQEVDGFAIFDAGVARTFDVNGTALTLNLFVNNIFDNSYFEASNTRGLVISAPRTVTASIGASF